jgi:hypothetical protein
MALDIDVPEPPDLSNRGTPSDFDWEAETIGDEDFYREDLEDLLQEGAWETGFDEWAGHADLDAEQARIVDELGLFQKFDFYRDPTDDRIGYEAPTMPEDWQEHEAAESLDSSAVSLIDNALDDLGRTVQEALEDYVERSDDVSDALWGEHAYGDREE